MPFEKEADLTAQNPLDTWLGPKIEEAAQLARNDVGFYLVFCVHIF